jgi:PAS domain S-box-containing protein
MRTRLIDKSLLTSAAEAFEFITNILESSTEYSIIGKDLEGRILLWNEGARRLYGYEPDEVVGKLDSSILHTPEDQAAGRPREIMEAALRDGKWEGTLGRLRKNGERFTARVVITPRHDTGGRAVGFLLISKDISEEIRLQEKVQATQFYTRSLIESNIDALMTTDPLGVISDVNQQMESLTGRGREELIGTPFKDYFTDAARAEEGIRRVLREGRVTNYELTARSRDGRLSVVSYNASTFRDGSGRLQGVFAAARDIAEQKNLEAQLRESEAYNRGLIEASVDGLVTVDPEGLVSDVNEQMCRMSGYSREELIGTPFADYFHDPERAVAGVQETFDRGVVTDYGLNLVTRAGGQLRVSFNASVFRNAAGDVRGIFASARDVTEQSKLQEQIVQERAYNRGLIEASLDGLITVDPLLTISDVNATMCRMSGYSREELVGSPFPSYFTNHRRAERKRFEQALQEKNLELERANFAKDRFLASMSHELRTPLNAILGFAGTLLMDLAGPVNAEQRDQLLTIQAGAQHLLSLINDLLDLAKIESGKVEMHRERIRLETLVEEVATSLRPLAVAKGLELIVASADDELVVFSDRRALSQILLNLINNAIKFTPSGRIEVGASRGAGNGDRRPTLWVVDTGVGISAAGQTRLFEAFARLQPDIAEEGTGLGLHLSQKLAALLGGRIEVESAVGHGSTFRLVLAGST